MTCRILNAYLVFFRIAFEEFRFMCLFINDKHFLIIYN